MSLFCEGWILLIYSSWWWWWYDKWWFVTTQGDLYDRWLWCWIRRWRNFLCNQRCLSEKLGIMGVFVLFFLLWSWTFEETSYYKWRCISSSASLLVFMFVIDYIFFSTLQMCLWALFIFLAMLVIHLCCSEILYRAIFTAFWPPDDDNNQWRKQNFLFCLWSVWRVWPDLHSFINGESVEEWIANRCGVRWGMNFSHFSFFPSPFAAFCFPTRKPFDYHK